MNKKIGNTTVRELLLLLLAIAILTLAVLGLMVLVDSVIAGGETTLLVGAYRDDIVLEMYSEPTSDMVSYYVDGDPDEHNYTIEWYGDIADGFYAHIPDTVYWTAFKLNNIEYATDIDGPHWIDDPADETGWLVRQVVNPTLEVVGDDSMLDLTLHEGWGEETIVYYSTDTPGEQVLEPVWIDFIAGKVLWRLNLDDVSNWTAFKVVATEYTPEVLVVSLDSDCWQDVGSDWIERIECDSQNHIYLPMVASPTIERVVNVAGSENELVLDTNFAEDIDKIVYGDANSVEEHIPSWDCSSGTTCSTSINTSSWLSFKVVSNREFIYNISSSFWEEIDDLWVVRK